jgi:hypothetical protein
MEEKRLVPPGDDSRGPGMRREGAGGRSRIVENPKEGIMEKADRPSLGRQARWVVGALAIVMAYFGAFGVLVYPVIEASRYMP